VKKVSVAPCGGAKICEFVWTAKPTLAQKITEALLKKGSLIENEKIAIACAQTQAIAIFTRQKLVLVDRLVNALKEIEAMERPLNPRVEFRLAQIASG
jgi:hypothetical protein